MIDIRQLLFSLSRVLALLVLCVAVAIVAPAFLSPQNLVNVLRQASLMIILATGLTAVILTGGIDLSVASLLALAACFGGMLMTEGIPWYLSALAALGLTTFCGLINGLMIAVVRLPAFIVTYGMLWIAQGFAVLVASSEVFYGFPPPFLFLGRGYLFGVPMPIVFMTLVAAAAWLLLHRTPLGREIYAMGANPEAARLSGIDVKTNLIKVYTASGFLAGLAGLILTARMNAASAEVSADQLLPAVAAVVIGGTSLFGGEGGIRGTVVGSLIMTVLINGMNLLNISPFWQLTAQGTVVIVAVLLDQGARALERRGEKSRPKVGSRPEASVGLPVEPTSAVSS